mmetsp:Transcript_34352/g.109707  ORF Transcript_34352/g.109707 Transcript_34352/m.109707 type:complete len:352 (+) Transcript_34352:841-1896(+)
MVHNGAAVPKRAHAAEPSGVAALPRRRELRLVQDADALDRGSHVRVEHAELCVGRRLIGHQLQPEAKKPRGTGSRFGMARVGLDAAHCRDGTVPCKQGRGERAHLDRVAERRARAVRLRAGEAVGDHGCVGERRLEERLLREPVGRGEAGALAVLPHAAAQRRGDRPASRRASLQKPRAARLATGVPVGPAVEGVGPAERRQHARDSEAVAHIGEQHQADAGHQPALALAEPQRTRGRVAGCERSRAGSVVGDSRPLHAEDVRQAARSNRMASSCRMVDATGRSGLSSHKLKVVRGDADEHSRQAAVQRRPLEAGCVQSAVAPLEQQALLRVHCARLRWRHAEVAAVEPVD